MAARILWLLADLSRWSAWWLMRSLVGWGALVCGDPRIAVQWTAETPRPEPLRRERALRREVERGIAELEAFLSRSTRRL